MKAKYWLIIFVIVFVAFMMFWFTKMDIETPEGYSFCKSKGFDSVSLLGSYSEKFGKVECYSSYKDNIIYEEFNVTKKFGIIMEIKEEGGDENGHR